MTNSLVLSDFEPLVGAIFFARVEEEATPLRLIKTRALAEAARPGGGFALTFAGPPAPLLPQATYSLANESLGETDIFIVPVARSAEGFVYEAVFG